MQYLKDEVRNRILEAALDEFNLKGYKGSSIRNIAKKASTSVGNFYKYFTSKEELFEKLIGSVYHMLMNYIEQFNVIEFNENTREIFDDLTNKLLEMFKENKIELTILLNKSEGSIYKDCKSVFADFITRIVTKTMEYEMSMRGRRLKDNFIIHLLSKNLVENIALILLKKEDADEIKSLILQVIDILYEDLAYKLDYQQLDKTSQE